MQAFNVSSSSVFFFSLCVQGVYPPNTPLTKVSLSHPVSFNTLRLSRPSCCLFKLKNQYLSLLNKLNNQIFFLRGIIILECENKMLMGAGRKFGNISNLQIPSKQVEGKGTIFLQSYPELMGEFSQKGKLKMQNYSNIYIFFCMVNRVIACNLKIQLLGQIDYFVETK